MPGSARKRDGLDQFVVVARRRHHAGEEISAAATRAPPCAATTVDTRRRAQRSTSGNFRARIGVRDRAADRAAAARLRMPDPGQRGGEQRLALRKFGQASNCGLPHAAPTRMSSPSTRDRRRAPAARMMSITTFGRARRMLSIGTSDLPAREDARVAAFAGERRRAPRRASRRGYSRTARASCAPPNSARRRATEPPSRIVAASWRASAAKNWPMMTRAAPSSRRPPTRRHLAADPGVVVVV